MVTTASGWKTQHCCDEPTVDRSPLDSDSARWLVELCTEGWQRDDAIRRLHTLLLGAVRWQMARSPGRLAHVGAADRAAFSQQVADDATVAVLDRLATYEGRARFTTWVYKFAVLHTSVALRRKEWQGREIPLEPTAWPLHVDPGGGPEAHADAAALAAGVRAAVANALTPHQRTVLVSLAVNDVPIDILADRLGTSRGALYKTLHDARARLRQALQDADFDVDTTRGSGRTTP
jgi:RNA polymerase sigma-70 factor, ECF subfamily